MTKPAPKPSLTRKIALTRLAVLAGAIAVPALAMSGDDPVTQEPAPLIVTPNDLAPSANFGPFVPAPAGYVESAAKLPAPMAADPLRITGSDQDHARAQRCMTMAVHFEADSETLDGQRAVAQVILNRVAHPAYPATVCGVVFQGSERSTGCQFSFTCDGTLGRRAKASYRGSAARVAREALSGMVHAPVGTATHYHTTEILPYWASSLDRIGVVGAHVFYRWRGKVGTKAAFTTRYAGNEPIPGKGPSAPAPSFNQPMALLDSAPVAKHVPDPVADQPDSQAAQTSILPSSGQVRAEYANSGKWLKGP